MKVKTWKDFVENSDKHASLAKPENLIIIDLLSSQESLAFDDLLTSIHTYNSEISVRQMRYILGTMLENKIIYEEDEKYYLSSSLNDKKSPVSSLQFLSLISSLILYLYMGNIIILFFSFGMIFILLIQQLQYMLSPHNEN